MTIIASWARVRGAWGRYAAPRHRGLLGLMPLRWLLVLVVTSIPLLVVALVIFLVALVVLPVLTLMAAIPVSVVYFLTLRRRKRDQGNRRLIEVEYRVVSRDEDD